MNNFFTLIIIVALAFGYVQNKNKVHEFLGLEITHVPKAETDLMNHHGINYVKLENPKSLNIGVHLMSASWCGYCKKLRHLLSTQGIPFKEYNVENDPVVETFLRENNIEGGVPVTVIGGDIVYGYDAEKLNAAFKRNKISVSGI